MSLKKPLGLGLLIGLLAMAFAALPAMAGAAELTDSTGNPLSAEPPTTITGTSIDAVTQTPLGPLVCEHVEVHGWVTENSGGNVMVSMDGEEDSATGCTFLGGPATVEPTLESITASGTSGTANFSFVVNGLTETSASTVSWEEGSSTLHVEGPVGGAVPGEFSGNFDLTDEIGNPVTIHE